MVPPTSPPSPSVPVAKLWPYQACSTSDQLGHHIDATGATFAVTAAWDDSASGTAGWTDGRGSERTQVDLIFLDEQASGQVNKWIGVDPWARRTFGADYEPPLGPRHLEGGSLHVGFLLVKPPFGRIGFFDVQIQDGDARVGFYLVPRCRSHDVLNGAIELLMEALEPWGAHSLTASVDPQDTTVVGLCTAAGLTAFRVDSDGQLCLKRLLRAA